MPPLLTKSVGPVVSHSSPLSPSSQEIPSPISPFRKTSPPLLPRRSPPNSPRLSGPKKTFEGNDVEKSLQHAIQQYGPFHKVVAAHYMAVGNQYFRQGNYHSAAGAYKQAIRCEPGPHLGDAYANLGTVYWTTGQVDFAVQMLEQALATYELVAVVDETSTSMVAQVHHQLGLAHCLQQDYEASLKSLEMAKNIRESRGDHIGVAKSFDAMGKVYFCMGNLEAALLHHQQALGIIKVTKQSCLATLKNMVQIYRYQQDWRSALAVYHEILREQKARFVAASSALNGSTSAKVVYETLLAMAECYQAMQLAGEAQQCRQEAMLMAEEAGLVRGLGK